MSDLQDDLAAHIECGCHDHSVATALEALDFLLSPEVLPRLLEEAKQRGVVSLGRSVNGVIESGPSEWLHRSVFIYAITPTKEGTE